MRGAIGPGRRLERGARAAGRPRADPAEAAQTRELLTRIVAGDCAAHRPPARRPACARGRRRSHRRPRRPPLHQPQRPLQDAARRTHAPARTAGRRGDTHDTSDTADRGGAAGPDRAARSAATSASSCSTRYVELEVAGARRRRGDSGNAHASRRLPRVSVRSTSRCSRSRRWRPATMRSAHAGPLATSSSSAAASPPAPASARCARRATTAR